MKLIVYGCSNTYGQGLSDCWQPQQDLPGRQPSKFGWPQQLANMLDIEVVNYGQPGASPKWVWHKILSTNFTKGDIVCAMWPHWHRWHVFDKDSDGRRLGTWSQDKSSSLYHKGSALYYKHQMNKYDHIQMWTYFCDHVYKHLKLLNIPFYQTYVCEDEDVKNIKNMINVKFSYGLDYKPRALDGSHPGEEAHKMYAEELYKRIKQCEL